MVYREKENKTAIVDKTSEKQKQIQEYIKRNIISML